MQIWRSSYLETDPNNEKFNTYEINIDPNFDNLQNDYVNSHNDKIIEKSENLNFLKIPSSYGAHHSLNSTETSAVVAVADTEIYNYKPTRLRK